MQPAPGARLAAQSWLALNSVELLWMLVICSAALPVLASVTERGSEAVPIVTVPKPIDGCDSVSSGAGEAMPTPPTDKAAVPPGALLAISTLAERGPSALGFNATVTVQVAAGATGVPTVQLPPSTMSAALVPVALIWLIFRSAWPLLVTVAVRAAPMVARPCAPRSSTIVSSANPGCALALPVPVSDTVAAVLLALWPIASVAARAPVAAGVKLSSTKQLLPAATLVPALQVEAEPIANSEACAPLTASVLTVSAAVPLLPSVTRSGSELVPTVCAKLNAVGESVTVGELSTPVPDNEAVLLPVLPLWPTVSVAERVPASVGLKVTVTEQAVPAASEVPTAQVPPLTA